MKKIEKLILSVTISYIFIGKFFTTWFYINNLTWDLNNIIFIHVSNLITLLVCLLLIFFVWNKVKKILYKILQKEFIIILVLLTIMAQLYIGLFEFLNKNPNVNQNKVLLLGDIPNLLSVFVLVALIIILTKKKD